MRCATGSPNLEPHPNRRGKAKQEVMRETRQLEGEVRKLQELYQGLQRDFSTDNAFEISSLGDQSRAFKEASSCTRSSSQHTSR